MIFFWLIPTRLYGRRYLQVFWLSDTRSHMPIPAQWSHCHAGLLLVWPSYKDVFSTHTEVLLPSCLLTYRCPLSSCIPFFFKHCPSQFFFKSCPGSFSNVAYFFVFYALAPSCSFQRATISLFWDSHKGTPILMLKKYFQLHSV